MPSIFTTAQKWVKSEEAENQDISQWPYFEELVWWSKALCHWLGEGRAEWEGFLHCQSIQTSCKESVGCVITFSQKKIRPTDGNINDSECIKSCWKDAIFSITKGCSTCCYFAMESNISLYFCQLRSKSADTDNSIIIFALMHYRAQQYQSMRFWWLLQISC